MNTRQVSYVSHHHNVITMASLVFYESPIYTWEHLPYIAVLKSVHRTAAVSSFDPQKKMRIELQTVAVLWTLF